MNQNRYPNQNQNQSGEQAPAPLSPAEVAALNFRLQQRLNQMNADPSGGHNLKEGEVLTTAYQDEYQRNVTVRGRFLGWTTNPHGETVPDIRRYVEPAPQAPAQPQPYPNQPPQQPGNRYQQRPVAPRPPQSQQQPPMQNRYPAQPYQGQGQYPQRPQQPQPPMYPGQQAPQPIAPPRTTWQGQPTQGFDVGASWAEPVVTPDQVPPGVQFGPRPEEQTVGLGPSYESHFGTRGLHVGDYGGAETQVEALGGVIGQTGEYGDDRFATPEMREDDMAAHRARVAAEEAAKRTGQQNPDQQPGQQ